VYRVVEYRTGVGEGSEGVSHSVDLSNEAALRCIAEAGGQTLGKNSLRVYGFENGLRVVIEPQFVVLELAQAVQKLRQGLVAQEVCIGGTHCHV
jgi:hypothetical protein